MVYVISITDEEVLSKIDTQYVMSKFSGVDLNAVIVFICTKENWRKEDTWKHKGETYYAIRLPYQQVRRPPAHAGVGGKETGYCGAGRDGGDGRLMHRHNPAFLQIR